MDLRQLRYFIRVAESGSISAAAAELFVAQSAISRQMRLLEEEIGGALFERSSQGVRVNEGGQLLLERAKFILGQIDATITDVSTRASEVRGIARFAAPGSLARHLTVPIATAFQERYPLAQLVISEASSDDIIERLHAGSLDVGIVTAGEEPPWLNGRFLMQERTILLCRRDAPPAASSSLSPETLRSLPLIVSPGVVKLFSSLYGELRPALQVHSVEAALQLSRLSHSYALVPESAMPNAESLADLVAVPVRRFKLSRWIVSPRDRPLSMSARALRATVDTVADQWCMQIGATRNLPTGRPKSRPGA